jgi:hypothetical protein
MALVKDSTVTQKQIYRYTFDIKLAGSGSVMLYTMLVNPQDMSFDEPARNTVTPTLGGAYVTDFGRGLPAVVLSGTTGYKTRTSAEGIAMDGFEAFINFRTKVYRNFIEATDPNLSLYWYNWEDDEYYEIQPTAFRLQRSKAEPLMYRYEFRFTCIRKLKDSRQVVFHDYLLTNPATRQIQLTVDAVVSAVSEFLTTVFGK